MPVEINEQFGEAVSSLLDARGLTLRAAMFKTKVDYGTIKNMRQGLVPKKGVVIDFAQGMGEPLNKWLELARMDPIPAHLVCDTPAEYRVVQSSSGVGFCLPTDAELDQESIDHIGEVILHGLGTVREKKQSANGMG